MKTLTRLLLILITFSCKSEQIRTGAEQPEKYLHLLKEKKVGLIVNQSSLVGEQHLLDFLLENEIDVVKVFSPEHGFRGDADAGEKITDERDSKTGLPIVSLYGKNKKPTVEQLSEIDLLIFDIQDVGVRFYTYISTLHYVMESCAENKKELLVLDRPNPNGDYLAGPVLKKEFQSFVGMHPIPIVHGCTVGELAQMINGEAWLKDGVNCRLNIIPAAGYNHNHSWSLKVKPSPNLPNDLSIRLYPSLCFFEATHASIGRGTQFPFQVIGFPDEKFGKFSFIPESIDGMAKNPKQKGKVCYGYDLRNELLDHRFSISYFLDFYTKFENEEDFISSERWFNLLAGTDQLIKDIRAGKELEEIESSWNGELINYKKMRNKYLLYPDFE